MAAKSTTQEETHLTISPPNFQQMAFTIQGDAPYVQNKFSNRAKQGIRQTQEEGSGARNKRKKEPKNFEQLYRESMHVSTEGWYGIPAPAFRNALVSACRTVGFKMTLAKLSVFIVADGFDADDGTPLVRITHGEPHYSEHTVRLQGTSMDIRPRAMWDPGWEAQVTVQWDADQFKDEDIANLMHRVGVQVGVGEGRPDSRTSTGMGWGTFRLVNR